MSDTTARSEDVEGRLAYSRCSSTGSLHTLTSSPNITDDEDSDASHLHIAHSFKDKRREAHTQAEQKRRDSIKKGYEELQELLPKSNSNAAETGKLSKASILQRSIDYVAFLQSGKNKQEDELLSLQKEVMAMTIMNLNYKKIVADHHSQLPGISDRLVPDQLKFQVFRAFLDSLYQTFEPSVHTNDFGEISASVIAWVENHCKPQILREVMMGVLQQVQDLEKNQPNQPKSSVNKIEHYY